MSRAVVINVEDTICIIVIVASVPLAVAIEVALARVDVIRAVVTVIGAAIAVRVQRLDANIAAASRRHFEPAHIGSAVD